MRYGNKTMKAYGYIIKWNKQGNRYQNETRIFKSRDAAVHELNHLILDESCTDARLFICYR